MTPQTTLNAVRELSENAMLRPAPNRLRLNRADDLQPGPRPAIIAYEDLRPIKIGGGQGTAGNYKPRKVHTPRQRVTRAALEREYQVERDNNFLERALAKTQGAAVERRPFVTPAGF